MKYGSEGNVRCDVLYFLRNSCGSYGFYWVTGRQHMSLGSRTLSSLLLGAAMVLSVAGVACAEHHVYRVYDPYYTDYHVWNDEEIVYYHRWCDETRRDRDRDFRKLSREEQKEYWTWRHNHGDRDQH
jgi:protein-tyrosine phosphatase